MISISRSSGTEQNRANVLGGLEHTHHHQIFIRDINSLSQLSLHSSDVKRHCNAIIHLEYSKKSHDCDDKIILRVRYPRYQKADLPRVIQNQKSCCTLQQDNKKYNMADTAFMNNNRNGAGSSGVDNLLAVVLKDLEARVAEWNHKVETERALIQAEWKSVEEEKQRLKSRTKVLDESAEDIANALTELHRLRQDLERRLAVTPMDLNASQLQEEWRRIDKEKSDLNRATEELQNAFDRLADAQAALEMIQ